MTQDLVIILAADAKVRPKSLSKVLGEPIIEWTLRACKRAELGNICIVTGCKGSKIENYLGERYATACAESEGQEPIMQAREYLASHIDLGGENTLVLRGNMPFLDERIITAALEFHIAEGNSVTAITADVGSAAGYGKVIRKDGKVVAISRKSDAGDSGEISSGAFWFNTRELLFILDEIVNAGNGTLPADSVGLLVERGLCAGAYMVESANTILTADSARELTRLNELARMAVIEKHMENGVEFPCTDGITIERDVTIGEGTTILTGTILKGKTIISEDCVIGPSCLIDDCIIGFDTKLNAVQAYSSTIGNNVKIGPFVHIRPNSTIKDGVKIGDFVEVKNSVIGENTCVAHLTYIGDSDVGKGVNFGCGCVTVNFDGVKKCRTTIGDGAFIGCQTKLIAPVKVGNGAYTAAGTTVARDIPENALAIDRGELRIKEGYALRKLRARKQ